MLSIKVNGSEEKFNIGCRSFVSLEELLVRLESTTSNVTINGKTVAEDQFAQIAIKSGDTLDIE